VLRPERKINRVSELVCGARVAEGVLRWPVGRAELARHDESYSMLHLTKLAVGVRDIPHLRELQADRAERNPPLRHRTRNFPRRAAEVLDGGSIYWVISGSMLARQRILDVIHDQWDDGSACAGLVLHPKLVPLAGRPTKPFQGWRYLSAPDAPPDLAAVPRAIGEAALPATLRRELQALCLL
jgi:hypothetical protein